MLVQQIKRREFIAALGGATVFPLAARAEQSGKLWRIGILETVPPELNMPNLAALRRGLHDFGYVEGRNSILEYRSADGEAARFPSLAEELVQAKVDVIVTRGTPAAQAAKSATSTIPIVMAAVGEALGVGVVETLARPGGNVTGMSAFTTELAGKRVELVKELLPALARIGLLLNMSNPVAPSQWEQTRIAARRLGIDAQVFDVRDREDIGRAIDAAANNGVDALLVGNDTVTQENRSLIADLATRQRLPTAFGSREFVLAGGLMDYAVSYPELYFRSARFVDKILKGAKPGDLPVEQPTIFELVVNLKTAKALGLQVPPSFLARADEVIE